MDLLTPLVGNLKTCAPLCLGIALLFICLFTHSYPGGQYTYIPLFLAPPAIFSFWTFGFNGDQFPPSRTIATGMVVVGSYGIMRVLEHTVIHLWEPESPRWVMRSKFCGPNKPVQSYYYPQTLKERCFYALDLLMSQRGSSWAGDRQWDWTPRCSRSSTRTTLSSTQHIASNIKIFIAEYLILDFIDTICKNYRWDINSLHPLTKLPFLHQLVFLFAICAGTYLSIAIQYIEVSTTCILIGSSTASWPPMFDSPFFATSLKDFWSRRWHQMFRRVFTQLSVPFVQLAIKVSGRKEGGLVTTTKVIMGFGFSTMLHLVIMHRVTHWEITTRPGGPNLKAAGFWDPDVFNFFMAQPLGIFVEVFLIEKFADWLFPPRQVSDETQTPPNRWERDAVTRLFAWCFLLWTGRWWCDKWVRVGFFDKEERVMPVSIIKVLWYGH
ncbi:hypothetical protein BU17DRAFT_57518 [Hysterangium stoloniferum]|nr:hypothetical protein BU17DRAFT_57518 [Hysterangium stoloniferum]